MHLAKTVQLTTQTEQITVTIFRAPAEVIDRAIRTKHKKRSYSTNTATEYANPTKPSHNLNTEPENQ